MTAAGAGRRSRSRSPAPCGCCGDPEGDGVRRRRRRTHGRRTASCGCPVDDVDDAEGGRRYWTGSPPRTPPDWRDSFQQLRRRWSDEARRRCTRRGSQDRARPANPSPGEIRALSGRNRPGAQPEYAASGPDPAPWTAEAQAATEPTLQQRLAELRRWQDATLRVSVEAVEPTSGSHFSLAACWDPDSTPNTLVSSTGGNPPPRRDTARTSAIGPLPVSSSSSSSSGSSQDDDGSSTEESDSEDQLEDPLEEVWDEVDEVLQENSIDKDDTRAEVESILRASVLSKGEKLAVINAALEDSAKDPEERRETAKSMLRRSTRGARELSDSDEPEREVSCSQVRRASEGRRSSRGSKVRSIVEEFEAEGSRVSRRSGSKRRTKKSILNRDHRKSTGIEDAEGRHPKRGKSVRWSRRSTVPVDSRKSSVHASAVGTEDSIRKSEHGQSQAPRKTGLDQELGSLLTKSASTAPKSVYYQAAMAHRPSHRLSNRRSSPWRVDSAVLRAKGISATGDVFDDTRAPENWSTEGRHGSRGSTFDSAESEYDEGTSLRHHSGRRSTARRSTKVPRGSHYRRSTAARSVNHDDDELLPTRSIRSRTPTAWPRHSSSADIDADEWATARPSGEASFHTTTDDTQRRSHRKSSRRSTHKDPLDTRDSRVSDIEEYSSEEETKRSSSRTSILEEGDPAEQQRWSSRRRDDEDDEDGGAAGASALSHRRSGRKSSARRGTYVDPDQSSYPRKKSNRNGMHERGAAADCCCVAGDRASCPALRSCSANRHYGCGRNDQLASASDFCCCRGKAASSPVMGDVSSSSSEECCCRSWNALPSVSRDESLGECTCYCDDVCGSAPELSIEPEDDVTHKCEPRRKTTARKRSVKKRDLEVELFCDCLGEEGSVAPAKEGDTCRQVCPAAKPCVAAPCKAALEDWSEPTCLCKQTQTRKKKKSCKPEPAVKKAAPAVQRRWWRLLLRYLPCVAAVVLWLACVWWMCGQLWPLFFPGRCRAHSCPFWTP